MEAFLGRTAGHGVIGKSSKRIVPGRERLLRGMAAGLCHADHLLQADGTLQLDFR